MEIDDEIRRIRLEIQRITEETRRLEQENRRRQVVPFLEFKKVYLALHHDELHSPDWAVQRDARREEREMDAFLIDAVTRRLYHRD